MHAPGAPNRANGKFGPPYMCASSRSNNPEAAVRDFEEHCPVSAPDEGGFIYPYNFARRLTWNRISVCSAAAGDRDQDNCHPWYG